MCDLPGFILQELDSMKRVHKQQTSNQSTTEVRLNRALEEVEKYKAQLFKSKSHVKVSLCLSYLSTLMLNVSVYVGLSHYFKHAFILVTLKAALNASIYIIIDIIQ
jgi:hypothetical protein